MPGHGVDSEMSTQYLVLRDPFRRVSVLGSGSGPDTFDLEILTSSNHISRMVVRPLELDQLEQALFERLDDRHCAAYTYAVKGERCLRWNPEAEGRILYREGQLEHQTDLAALRKMSVVAMPWTALDAEIPGQCPSLSQCLHCRYGVTTPDGRVAYCNYVDAHGHDHVVNQHTSILTELMESMAKEGKCPLYGRRLK